MARWPRTYRFLADSDDVAADEALAAAARRLDGPYLRYAIEVLLHRAEPAGLPAVIESFHRLPADLQRLVLTHEPVLAHTMRTAVRDSELQTRLNCLEMASRMGSEGLAYLFDLGLLDTQAKVRESAAIMMRQMALKLLADHPLLRADDRVQGRQSQASDVGQHGQADNSPSTQGSHSGLRTEELAAYRSHLALRRHHLFEALLSGAQRYEMHLRPEVFEACLWFEPYLGQRLWDLLHRNGPRFVRLASDLMIRSDEPQSAFFLMQALADQSLRPAALKAITERRDVRWFGGVLRGVERMVQLAEGSQGLGLHQGDQLSSDNRGCGLARSWPILCLARPSGCQQPSTRAQGRCHVSSLASRRARLQTAGAARSQPGQGLGAGPAAIGPGRLR